MASGGHWSPSHIAMLQRDLYISKHRVRFGVRVRVMLRLRVSIGVMVSAGVRIRLEILKYNFEIVQISESFAGRASISVLSHFGP